MAITDENDVGTAYCDGTITTTYTWVPDPSNPTEAAPQQVLVQESCTAFGIGGANDGFEDDWNPDTYTSQGTKYQVVSGGSSVTVTCTPTSTTDDFGYGESCYVDYGVSVTPIVITFESPVIGYPGAYRALVGQKLTAHLSIGADNNIYSWTIGGCNPFDSFVYNNEYSEVIGIDPSVYSIPSPTVHCSTAGSVSYACSGTTHGQSFSVTENVGVQRPTIAYFDLPHGSVGMESGGVLALLHVPLSPDTPEPTDGTELFGIAFNAEVDIPAPFTGVGSFYFIQKVVPQRTLIGPAGGAHVSLNGFSDVLDTSVPYGTGAFAKTTFATGTSSTDKIGDGPIFGLALPNYDTSVVSGESFETYLMFVPPGPGSQPVTISRGTWSWSGAVHHTYDPATSMVDYWFDSGNVSATNGSDTSEFPIWAENITSATIVVDGSYGP